MLLKKLGCQELFAMPDKEGRTPAHIAAKTGHVVALRALVQGGDDDVPTTVPKLVKTDSGGPTKTGPAAAEANIALVLIKDADGCFPAHLAAHGGHTECVKYIHGLGVEAAETLEAANDAGKTAVELASASGHQETTRAFEALGLLVQVRTFLHLLLSCHATWWLSRLCALCMTD